MKQRESETKGQNTRLLPHVLDIVMNAVEDSLTNEGDARRKVQLEKDISALESKKSRMTDMLIDGTISKEVYDEKLNEFMRKLHTLNDKKKLLKESISHQKDIGRRMAELRVILEQEKTLDEIDETTENNLCDENSSCEADGVHEISLSGSADTHRMCGGNTKETVNY
ncbi:MAG: hypothetical protein HFG57_00295 [Lachnospiraceae bacterium]|nr:hypothetical protein [Lachnospiraceae bacterium]